MFDLVCIDLGFGHPLCPTGKVHRNTIQSVFSLPENFSGGISPNRACIDHLPYLAQPAGFQDVSIHQTGNEDPKKDENVKFMPDGKPPSKTLGIVPTILKWTNTLTGQDRKGGGGQEGEAQRAAKLFNQALNNPFDMYNLEMEIIGDPYYIAQSGTGNYTSEQATPNLNTDGSVNYESGEVDIIVNFRTPIDINQGTGLYNFGGTSKSAPVTQFSGLYCVQTIKSKFADGKFTQVLTGFRRPTQEYEEEPTADDLPATTRTVTSTANSDSDTEESGT